MTSKICLPVNVGCEMSLTPHCPLALSAQTWIVVQILATASVGAGVAGHVTGLAGGQLDHLNGPLFWFPEMTKCDGPDWMVDGHFVLVFRDVIWNCEKR